MLLIDGYNLLFSGPRVPREKLPQARQELAVQVARYCEAAGLRARIIFDFTQGPPAFGIPLKQRIGDVEVWFTPQGVSADDEILGLIEGTSDRTAFTVVTSDRGIADGVARRQVKVVDSGSFRKEMTELLHEPQDEAPEKGKGLGPGEVDYWMREFGLDE